MLYHLLYALRGEVGALNVTRYITFRTAVASLTALFLVLVLGPWMIERLRLMQIGQHIREEGPQAHKAKAGTPTMGGVLILTGVLVPTARPIANWPSSFLRAVRPRLRFLTTLM